MWAAQKVLIGQRHHAEYLTSNSLVRKFPVVDSHTLFDATMGDLSFDRMHPAFVLQSGFSASAGAAGLCR